MNKFHSRLAVSGLFFLHGLCFSSWGARIPAIQEKLQLSEAQLGSVLFGLPVGSLISMPIAAYFISKFGSRSVLLAAILLYALLLTTLGLATSALGLVCLLVIFGLASNLVNISLNTQAIDLERLYQRTIMSSLHGLWSSAGFVGAALGAVMIGAGITPSVHFCVVLLIVVLCLLVSRKHLLRDQGSAEQVKKFAWPDGKLIELGIIAFCSMICEGAMFDWSGVYFKNIVGAEGAWVSAGYVAFMTTMAGTRFFADGFKAKYGLKNILFVSGIVIFVGFLLSILFPTLAPSMAGFFLIGAGVSGIVPLVMSEAGKSRVMSPSAAVASVSTIGFLGFLVGPPMVGWIAGVSTLRVSFSVVAVLGLSITFIAMRYKNSET